MRVLAIAGARPNLMKIAPLMAEMTRYPEVDARLIHTGQHYDPEMSQVFFDQLGLTLPDENLHVGSGSNAWQTAQIMLRLEPLVAGISPDVVVVVGDVNSTLAGALVGAKTGVPVAHVEAGLRSFDPSMPEELNRKVTDSVSRFLFTPSRDANENLLREGITEGWIHFVGNIMVDSLMRSREAAARSGARAALGLDGSYALVTLHRPSNVDDPNALRRQVEALSRVAKLLPVVFPVHPRTTARLEEHDLLGSLTDSVQLVTPLGYLDFLDLMTGATVVLTDSGGVQEETSVLDVPCLTLRDNTERPVTVSDGTNSIVGTDPDVIVAAVGSVLTDGGKKGRIPELWDGRTAERIVAILMDALAVTQREEAP